MDSVKCVDCLNFQWYSCRPDGSDTHPECQKGIAITDEQLLHSCDIFESIPEYMNELFGILTDAITKEMDNGILQQLHSMLKHDMKQHNGRAKIAKIKQDITKKQTYRRQKRG